MCSGVVPQQPPTRPARTRVTNASSASASSSGVQRVVGAVRRRARGRPALGITDTGDARVLGQVAQVLAHLGRARWRSSARSGRCRAARARSAPRRSREPSSIVPVVSTVTWAMIGTSAAGVRPSPAARRGPRPWPAAGPGRSRRGSRRRRPRACRRPAPGRRRAARRTARGPAWAAWCRARPSRARSAAGPAVRHLVGDLAGDRGARLRRARGSGRRCRTRRGRPGWRRTCWSRPRRRRPRSRRRGWPGRRPGRVTLRISLQPSRPSKSSSVEIGGLQHGAHRAVGDHDALDKASSRSVS